MDDWRIDTEAAAMISLHPATFGDQFVLQFCRTGFAALRPLTHLDNLSIWFQSDHVPVSDSITVSGVALMIALPSILTIGE